MDESLKDILSRHWNVLVRYINPTSSLINVLVEDKVLPSAMIEDIKKGNTRREKNEILLKSMKLRGNMSYRKFRDAMLKCGQIFIADLLYEEETTGAIVEEGDITSVPALKLSLSPEEIKQLVATLDARIRCRFLKTEWRKDSQRRIDILQQRADDYMTEKEIQSNMAEYEQKIKQMTAELNVKNDIIRSLSLDINCMNQEVISFTKRHQSKSGRCLSPTQVNDNSNMQHKLPSRFSFFENSLWTINQKLSNILGESFSEREPEQQPSIGSVESKVVRVQQAFREMESKLAHMQTDKEKALTLLFHDKKTMNFTLLHGVQKFVMQEQRYKYSLLKDIDRLSRKLRGISSRCPTSGLFALRQSAVTGKPKPETIDYRFLSNHISLLEADAEHMQKKIGWKDAEIKSLQGEVVALRKRFNCPRDEDANQQFEAQCD